jgi:hypothetical protein
VTSSLVLAALEHLEHERTTVAANRFHAREPADLRELERRLRERRLHRNVAIPEDGQLAAMLETAPKRWTRCPRVRASPSSGLA